MYKYLIFSAFFLATSFNATAQTPPWFQMGNEWTYDLYLGWNPQWGLHRFVIGGEITLGASGTWTRIVRSHASGGNTKFYYARQEGEKIYSISGLGGTPVCIYDFGMQPGDTLFFSPLNYYTVQDTGSIFAAGRIRRTQTVRPSNDYYTPLLLVEGIGPVWNPEQPGDNVCSFFFLNEYFCHAFGDLMSAYFRCYADADGSYAPFDGCLVSNSDLHSPESLKVWPNPAADYLYAAGDFCTAELFDAQGRSIPTQMTYHEGLAKIPISHLPNGVYWLRCQNERGDQCYKSVVVAHP